MANEEELKFELDVVSDPTNHILAVKNYDNTYAKAVAVLKGIVVPDEITNDLQKKELKNLRASCNSAVKLIDRNRIDAIEEYVGAFADQCKALRDLFDEKQRQIGEKVKAYEDKQKLAEVSEAKKLLTFEIKFYEDESILKKLVSFCEKNGCSLREKK